MKFLISIFVLFAACSTDPQDIAGKHCNFRPDGSSDCISVADLPIPAKLELIKPKIACSLTSCMPYECVVVGFNSFNCENNESSDLLCQFERCDDSTFSGCNFKFVVGDMASCKSRFPGDDQAVANCMNNIHRHCVSQDL